MLVLFYALDQVELGQLDLVTSQLKLFQLKMTWVNGNLLRHTVVYALFYSMYWEGFHTCTLAKDFSVLHYICLHITSVWKWREENFATNRMIQI